jgi:hypothetical protein
MSKHNFQVRMTVTAFIQRDCTDAEEIEDTVRDLENCFFTTDDFMPGTEVEIDNAEVLVHGEQE